MRLLILTQYFPPEVGAPQNRLYELARHLAQMGVEVSVLTAMPNYPQMRIHPQYKGKHYVFEEKDGIKIHRSHIFVSRRRSITARLRNYFSFVLSSALIGRRRLKKFDFLFCESPPLFLGYTAMYLARIKKAKLIFNVSDLWPESAERLGVVRNPLLLKMAYKLEAKLYHKAVLVTGQTQGICNDIQRRFPNTKTYWLPNGADLGFYDPTGARPRRWRAENGIAPGDHVFMYAGIIGLAQGLDIILECAVRFLPRNDVKFVLLGSGPEKDKLLQMKEKMNLHNVIFMNAVPRQEMPSILCDLEAAIIPLKKLDIFKGAIPSKIFENLAMQVPVLLGVDGEARELFIEQGRCGLYFEPEDAMQLAQGVERLLEEPDLRRELGRNGRAFVQENFNRAEIARAFYEELSSL